MRLVVIRENLKGFEDYLATSAAEEFHLFYETIANWQSMSPMPKEDLLGWYDRALHNTSSTRLWKQDQFHPKSTLLRIAASQTDTLSAMFDDLFDEAKSIDGRVSRFIFGCDLMLQEYREEKTHTVEANHYHDDFSMISIYLMCQRPEGPYGYYDVEVFRRALETVGASKPLLSHDFSRFVKMLQILHQEIEKVPSIAAIQERRLSRIKGHPAPYMLAAEYMHYLATLR